MKTTMRVIIVNLSEINFADSLENSVESEFYENDNIFNISPRQSQQQYQMDINLLNSTINYQDKNFPSKLHSKVFIGTSFSENRRSTISESRTS